MLPLPFDLETKAVLRQLSRIHPFYDGNGRTGRVISVLYLVINGLLDLPILYLSRYITHNKGTYYRLIQHVRDTQGDTVAHLAAWEEWILFLLKGVEVTSEQTIRLVEGISMLMAKYKQRLRPLFAKAYKHELLNNLFSIPIPRLSTSSRTWVWDGRRPLNTWI